MIMYRGLFFKLLTHMNILSTNGLLSVIFVHLKILTEHSITVLVFQFYSFQLCVVRQAEPLCVVSFKSCYTFNVHS